MNQFKIFLSRDTVVVNHMKSFGENISDQKVVEKVLRSLPSQWDHIVTAIEESKDMSTYSMNDLMGSLLAHESRMGRSFRKNMEQAFQSKMDFSNKGKHVQSSFPSNKASGYSGRGRGRGTFRGRERGRGRSSSGHQNSGRGNYDRSDQRREDIQCYSCNRYGHIAVNCPNKGTTQTNFVEANQEGDNLFIACQESKEDVGDVWFLDSGCSNHMTGEKNNFKHLDESLRSQVRIGDNKQLDIEGKGAVAVNAKSVLTWTC